MKLWPPRFGAPIFKLVSSCSLLLLLVVAHAYDYQALDDRLLQVATPEAAKVLLKAEEPGLDADIQEAIDELPDHPSKLQTNAVEWQIAQRAMRQGMDVGDPAGDAKRIKQSALFQDQGDKQQSNWLGQAFGRLRNMFNRDDERPPSHFKTSGINFRGGGVQWLTWIVWLLLGAAVAAFAYFAFRQVSFKRGLRRRRKAVLEEDEPERTLDEWLEQADQLAMKGQYREAVRALYLACLLKFDERRVARFVRADTNWEHLARIQASPQKPPGLDFRPATQSFDQVWYGKRVEGLPDVERFRSWYGQVKTALEGGS